MAVHAPAPLDPDAYLAIERDSDIRHEYLDGEVLALAGGTLRHNLILSSALRSLGNQLEGGPCVAVPNDLRVATADRTFFAYPDIVVWCGEPELQDAAQDTLLNPVVIIEVLSPSTEAFCRGEKFARYRSIPSLQCYLLIAQDRPRIERFLRHTDRDATHPPWWRYQAFDDLEDRVELPSIQAALRLAKVYGRSEP